MYNSNDKRNFEIVWQSAMKAAIDLVPEEKKGTEEGFEMYADYHTRIYKKFLTFHENLSKQNKQ